jgi:hypothetical protein
MYLRVREIFALAADYSPSLAQTTQFFRVIQNKLHFAVTGKTAAELIIERADGTVGWAKALSAQHLYWRRCVGQIKHAQPTCWKSGRVQKADITVAKNYLLEAEIAS